MQIADSTIDQMLFVKKLENVSDFARFVHIYGWNKKNKLFAALFMTTGLKLKC